ncbi:hypothetical protein [Streptomyces sp. NPDC002324]
MVHGVLFGGLTAVVSLTAVGRAWAACDVGSGPADVMTLLLLAPFVWIAAAAAWTVPYGTLGRRRPGAALAVGLVLALVSSWFLVTWLGMPDGYPDPVCPGNVPPWWPGFIPA